MIVGTEVVKMSSSCLVGSAIPTDARLKTCILHDSIWMIYSQVHFWAMMEAQYYIISMDLGAKSMLPASVGLLRKSIHFRGNATQVQALIASTIHLSHPWHPCSVTCNKPGYATIACPLSIKLPRKIPTSEIMEHIAALVQLCSP